MRLQFIILAALLSAWTSAADITFDAQNLSHQFKGFGAQVWAGDTRVEPVLSALNMKYVRMKFGGNWIAPTDATQAQMDAYVASRYDSDNAMRTTYNMLNSSGIQVIANYFEGPADWLGYNNRLNSSNFDDMARLWASIAAYMQNNNMPITYIEMFNEPEGNWNIYVPAGDYNTVVKLLRQELDSRELLDVQICGPGLAYLLNAPNWVNALDSSGVVSLGAWSTHAWDEGWGNTAATPDFLDGRYMDYWHASIAAKDPYMSKPVIITEYATGVRTFNGVTFAEDIVSESTQFAQRCYENSLTLLNNGANVLCYWQASDHDWMSQGTYGFIRKQSLGSTLKPVYYSMSTLMSELPENAWVLKKTWNDPSISAAAFASPGKLVCAFANSTAQTQSRSIFFTGIASLDPLSATAFVDNAVTDVLDQIHVNYATSEMNISLAPESTLTIVFSADECTSTSWGDISGDCRVDFMDIALLAKDWAVNGAMPTVSVIDDYESYSTDGDLLSKWTLSSNTTATLETETVFEGENAGKYVFRCGTSPYYAKASYQVEGEGASGADWRTYNFLSIRLKMGTVTQSDGFMVDVMNYSGSRIRAYQFGSQKAHENGQWYELVCDLSLIPNQELATVGRIDLAFQAASYGTNTAYFDSITLSDSSSVSCGQELPGDVSGNCVVDFQDLLIITGNWLDCSLLEQSQCWN